MAPLDAERLLVFPCVTVSLSAADAVAIDAASTPESVGSFTSPLLETLTVPDVAAASKSTVAEFRILLDNCLSSGRGVAHARVGVCLINVEISERDDVACDNAIVPPVMAELVMSTRPEEAVPSTSKFNANVFC